MQRKTRWLTGTAVAGALLLGATLATGASAQMAPSPGAPGAGFCPGYGVMAGFGPGAATNAGTYGAVHDAIANAVGITPQELRDARAAGRTVAELAADKNVPLQTVVDAAVAAHSAQLDAAVQAGTLTQAQADAMTQLTRSRMQAQLQTGGGFGIGQGPGMIGGRGMMGGFGMGPGRRVP
jgi:alkylated DNA nucleotide flippase Atl1